MAVAASIEVRTFQVTIPAGTPQAAPLTVDIPFPPRTVNEITWRVPPGPSGLMGWRLTMGGAQAIPNNPGAWIITDDERDSWPLYGQPDSGAWQVTGYNTDIYDHTVILTFLLDLPGNAAAPAAAAANDTTAAILNLAGG
jgi:hypothetical protein